MTRKEFTALFEEIVEASAGSITGAERLQEDLEGWTSIAVVSLMALVDEHFDMRLSPDRIANCQTVNDLIDLLGNKISDS